MRKYLGLSISPPVSVSPCAIPTIRRRRSAAEFTRATAPDALEPWSNTSTNRSRTGSETTYAASLLHERPCTRAATSAKPVGVGSNFGSVFVTIAARWFSTVAADPEVGGDVSCSEDRRGRADRPHRVIPNAIGARRGYAVNCRPRSPRETRGSRNALASFHTAIHCSTDHQARAVIGGGTDGSLKSKQ
jgi:hypothetical protein